MNTSQRIPLLGTLVAAVIAAGNIGCGGGSATARVVATGFGATGNMTEPRFYHDASTLNDGTILISGGSEINTRAKATAEIYDPTMSTFTATGSMNAARVWHTSTVLQNGKVLITGGGDNGAVPIATAEIYQ